MCGPEKSQHRNDNESATRPGYRTSRSKFAEAKRFTTRDATATASGSVSSSKLAGNPLQARFSSLRRPQSALSLLEIHAEADSWGDENQRLSLKERFKIAMAQPTPHSDRSQKRQLVKVKPKPFAVSQPVKNMEFKKLYREVEEGRESEYIMQAQRMQKLIRGPYEKEKFTPRNQTVLGLKYIHDRYGYHPRRRVPHCCELPEHIDHVSGYHCLSAIAPQPPPGLDTQPGQFDPVAQSGNSVLCKFRHQRMRRSSHGPITAERELK